MLAKRLKVKSNRTFIPKRLVSKMTGHVYNAPFLIEYMPRLTIQPTLTQSKFDWAQLLIFLFFFFCYTVAVFDYQTQSNY